MIESIEKVETEKGTLVYHFPRYINYNFVGKLVDGIIYSLDGTICYGLDPDENAEHNEKFKNIKILPGTKVIAENAFSDAKPVDSVELPPSVEVIEDKAFVHSSIKNINLENVLKFGKSAFAVSWIKYAAINEHASFDLHPSKDSHCFSNCLALEKIDFGPSEIPSYLCDDCRALKEFNHKNNITSIGTRAFAKTYSLENFIFPEGLETIRSSAFEYSSIKSAVFPSSLRTIDRYAFIDCDFLSSISFTPSNTPLSLYNGCFMSTAIEKVTLPKNIALDEPNIFKNCAMLKNAEILSDTDYIPPETFSDCTGLEHILFNPDIKSVGHNCFSNTGLEKIDENFKNITFFGYECFSACKQLRFAHTSKDAELETHLFADCNNLELAIIEGATSAEIIFNNCPKDLHIIAPLFKKNFYHTEECLTNYGIEEINKENIDILLGYMSFKEVSKMLDNFSLLKTQNNEEITK